MNCSGTMKPTSRKIIKPTFEAVYNAQELLRLKFDELIRENRSIKDEKERAEFMHLVSHALLGLGINHRTRIEWHSVEHHYPGVVDSNHSGVDMSYNLEQLLRVTTYFKNDLIPQTSFERLYTDIPIGFLWRILQVNCFAVFPSALDKSLSMSKEKDEQPKTDGFSIE